LVEVRLDEFVARGAAVAALVLAPDISLKRLVVPRVAPMLDPLVEDVSVVVVEVESVEVEVEVETVAGVTEPTEAVLEYIRPRSLRLPRIWGAMMVANFSAWMVPATRMVRCRSPGAIAAVWMTVVAVFPEEELARLVRQ